MPIKKENGGGIHEKKRVRFSSYEFPKLRGLVYLMDQDAPATDYLFVGDRRKNFSMYFENNFPIFTLPENNDRPYCLFDIQRPGRRIHFFCPERHKHLDSVVWYFYVELFDNSGISHILPGQIRVPADASCIKMMKGKPKFIEVLEQVRLTNEAIQEKI